AERVHRQGQGLQDVAQQGRRGHVARSAGVRPAASVGIRHPGNQSVLRRPIEVTVSASSPAKVPAGALVVGAFADGTPAPAAHAVDRVSNGLLSAVMKLGDLPEKAGSPLWLYRPPEITAQRVLLVSLGPRERFGDEAFRHAIGGAARALRECAADDAAVTLAGLDLPGPSLEWCLQQATRVLADGLYRFNPPGASGEGSRRTRGPRRVSLLIGGTVQPEHEAAVRRGHAIADGMSLARDLGNLPGNVCHPAYLADTARS